MTLVALFSARFITADRSDRLEWPSVRFCKRCALSIAKPAAIAFVERARSSYLPNLRGCDL